MSEPQVAPASVHDSRFTGTLAIGLLAFLVEGGFAIEGLVSMAQGSCSAALISLWFGIPLVVATIIAFVIGSIKGRQEGPNQKRSRAIGLAVALAAIPVWMFASLALGQALHLG